MSEQAKSNSSIGSILGIIAFGLLCWWIASTLTDKTTWQGMYELPTDNTIHATSGFESKELCQEWLDTARATNTEAYNLECGSNCKPPHTSVGAYRCEETFN